MTADPIAGIVYPVRSVAPNISDTMKPPIDAIGARLGPDSPKHYASTVNATNVPSGTTLATIVIPSQPIASRIMIRFSGMIGYEGGGVDMAASVTASAGTLTSTIAGANVAPAASQWMAYTYEAWLTLAVSTATTLTLGSYTSAGNAYFRGMFTAEILFTGEFA